jgi:LmbE family N-acetylglucosaminyl deacetylase
VTMKVHKASADIFVPDGRPLEQALGRVSRMGIGAHPDDLEFMALPGIAAGYDQAEEGFGGVTCTDGAGSARVGPFAEHTDEQMRQVRREEQREAARRGRYAIMIQLDYASADLQPPRCSPLEEDLVAVLSAARPRVVYTHNPADKHPTHVAVAAAVIRAVRALPADQRPARLYGGEIWRGLDWMPDADKVVQDVTGRDALAADLASVFASQIRGGKRYDLATEGRRRANATFLDPVAADTMEQACLAMDLTPLTQHDHLNPVDYVMAYLKRFSDDVRRALMQYFD